MCVRRVWFCATYASRFRREFSRSLPLRNFRATVSRHLHQPRAHHGAPIDRVCIRVLGAP